ncbi:hypothetical protein ACFQL5_10970, partial [Aquipuribacter hungaricus]
MKISQGASFVVATVALGAVSTASVASVALVGWSTYSPRPIVRSEALAPQPLAAATVRPPAEQLAPVPVSSARASFVQADADREEAAALLQIEQDAAVQRAVDEAAAPNGLVETLVDAVLPGINALVDDSVVEDEDLVPEDEGVLAAELLPDEQVEEFEEPSEDFLEAPGDELAGELPTEEPTEGGPTDGEVDPNAPVDPGTSPVDPGTSPVDPGTSPVDPG